MKFGIEKATMFVMKSGKRQMTEIELPNKQKKNQKKKLQVLGNIESKYYQTRRDETKK